MMRGRGCGRVGEEKHVPDFECVLREYKGVNVMSTCSLSARLPSLHLFNSGNV